MRVVFEHAQRAVTPGQYAVAYEGERCLGGAVIEHRDRQCPQLRRRGLSLKAAASAAARYNSRLTAEVRMTNSFKARSTLTAGGSLLRDLEPGGAAAGEARTTALLAEDPAGEPAALRRRRERHARGHRSAAQLGSGGGARRTKSPSPRRASSCRTSRACPAWSISPRCAMRSCGSAATPSASIRSLPPSSSSTTPCRSMSTARAGPGGQHRHRVRAQRRALLVPALGSDRVPQLHRSCRPTPASCTR